jgi:hypothetical protein
MKKVMLIKLNTLFDTQTVKYFSMKNLLVSALLLVMLVSCASKQSEEKENISFLIDPANYFKIELNSNPPHSSFEQFQKYVDVFGVKIFAMADVSDLKLLYSANVLAQYLDNDEDGTIDDQKVMDKMLENKAYVMMVKTGDSPDLERFFNSNPPEDMIGQDLYDDETLPDGSTSQRFNACLEEILHIVNFSGHTYAYPELFGLQPGSKLSNAMDIARGGQFTSIPANYPDGAWYSYDDETCDYGCMGIEYMYWALTSILGAQDYPGRLEQIQHEWKLNTREKVMNTDKAVYQLLTDPQYKMPTVLPDGKYRQ